MTPLVLLSTSRGKDANAKSLAAYLTRSVLTPIATKAATAAGSVSAASEPIKYRCSSTELQCGYSGGVDVYLAIDNQHRSTFLEHSVYLYSAALEVCPQLSISIIPVIRTAEAATCGTASKEETHAPAASPSPSARSKQQQQQFDGVQRGGSDVIELYDDAAAVLREWKLVDKAFMRDAEGFKPHYKYVAVGGTFDHFHSGHKVLLSTAALHAIQKLRVGVTDASLLTRKKFAESLQSIELRMENVAQFLQKMRPDLELELEPISEISGGTKSIPDVEALVVSPETAKSLGLINEMRSANGGLAPMVGISIPLVESPTGELISSTALRGRQTQAD
ncbi:conserved hypothetical protein [Leishmania infantum JPCM5]|uniref:Cytidylyltransferase_-_putative n=2 Tax=Leishmania infantum TaxID=5671 RepID=A0A6L0XNL1_LEIIN|nr:conserved hypothetical protein [Leishmania infantum JPCM5]CAC9525674.1 Cytidylyltransferase_-_putative [Leishmania infantum]CAM70969.1 conserved hypothetical protein [Leishmania infantum JPCM5]SUZ44783.1 Cytidylyltransferase_-_putative [Leishmania infantum]|eukprot:XP_001467898.1 conserved hypothetical protein [Leishmania infantum JPCM5]